MHTTESARPARPEVAADVALCLCGCTRVPWYSSTRVLEYGGAEDYCNRREQQAAAAAALSSFCFTVSMNVPLRQQRRRAPEAASGHQVIFLAFLLCVRIVPTQTLHPVMSRAGWSPRLHPRGTRGRRG